MKIKTSSFALVLALFSTSSFALTQQEAQGFLQQIDQNPDSIVTLLQADQENMLDLVEAALADGSVDAQTIVQSAIEANPELLDQIVELARKYEVSNEVITTAALLAGIDPTLVSDATAAGNANALANAIAPPATLAVGGNGGGGSGVVSPN
ncbi:hypothetical protein [Vibrio sp. SCSIO 43136]|uniref:hypothetical protein n=1 Tax=Vibrio sp. SCSIO 43136 TaxID=2819101 RepID=UPI002076626C|nr:hypothetical protein [Vibrio sp. SCSIO 43136]USD67031.1 hypothetical protein J4N39_20560 [Vibrio sp. SCSIO 43136]